MEVFEFRQKLERKKGQVQELKQGITQAENRIKKNTKSKYLHEKALEVIKEVGIKTQSQLSYNISEIVGMAMQAVLEKPYEIELDFVDRRGTSECDIYFVRNENRVIPFFAGGGAKDVASFALRVASWSMQLTKSRNVIITDEPFKLLKGEQANSRMLEMIKEVSEKLGLQIIMVADERVSRNVLEQNTNRLFEVSIKKGVSQIKTTKNGI